MEKMLVVIFDDEGKAYEASRALNQLDLEGSISIHAESVVTRNTEGALSIKQADGDFPIRTLAGTALGSLIGLLGGPVGWGIGTTAGYFAGLMGDMHCAGVDGEFLDDVSKALKPGKSAVVADISEEWVTPVDTRMEALGGTVIRTTRSAVEHDQAAREQAAVRGEIASLKAEHAKAQTERKKRLQSRIEQLEKKLQAKLERNKEEREEHKREMDAKVSALQQRAKKAQGEAKAAFEARAADLQSEFKFGKAKEATAGAAGSHH